MDIYSIEQHYISIQYKYDIDNTYCGGIEWNQKIDWVNHGAGGQSPKKIILWAGIVVAAITILAVSSVALDAANKNTDNIKNKEAISLLTISESDAFTASTTGDVTLGATTSETDRKGLTVTGQVKAQTLITESTTTLGGALTTTDENTPVTIGETNSPRGLKVTGDANLVKLTAMGSTSLNGGLTVTGSTSLNGDISANSYNGMITTTDAVVAIPAVGTTPATPTTNAKVTLATTSPVPASVDLSVSGDLFVTGRVEDGNGELIKAKGSTTIVLQASEGQSIDTAIYKNQLRAEGYEVDDGRLFPGIQSGFVTIQTAFRRHSTNSATTPTATKGYQIKHPNLHTTSSNSLNAANTFMTTTPFLSRTTSGISALVNEFTVVELELVDPTAADAITKPATLKFLVNVDVFYLNLSGSLLLQLQKGEVTVAQSLNDSTLLAANIPTIAEVQALISATFTMPYAIIKV